MNKFKKIVTSLLVLIMIMSPVNSFAAGSNSTSGAIGSVYCWGQVNYANTYATALTQISSADYVSVVVTACCSGANVGKKKTSSSATDSIAAEASTINASGTVIVGTISVHAARYGAGSWSQKLNTGETW